MGVYFRARPGLKTGAKNDIFWSEIGSGIGEPGGTSPPRIFRSSPSPRAQRWLLCNAYHHAIFDTPNWHL